MVRSKGSGSLIAGGVLAAIGAHLCCIGPVVLLSLGIGGTWAAHSSVIEPYRPIFIGLTILFLGMAFRRLYLMPRACVPGTPCTGSRTIKRQSKHLFWTVAVLLSVSYLSPFFY